MNIPIFNGVIFYLTLLFNICFLTACSGVNADSPSADNEDQEILDALYRDIRTPPDFYTEEFSDNDFTSLSHVKSVILNHGEHPIIYELTIIYELSADDFSEALEFSEIEADLQFSYKQMVDVTETEFYFQFTRVNPGLPEFVHFSRVFKQSSLDRSGVDRSQPDGYQGIITIPELTVQRVKDIIEYLWNFTLSNNYGNVVVESETSESLTEFVHSMIEARLVISSSNTCDTVEVFEIQNTVQKGSGLIWKESTLLREISMQRDGSGFYLCEV